MRAGDQKLRYNLEWPKLRDAHGTPTFKTEALRLVSNVQLVKELLLRNELLIQHYLALLRQ